MCLLACACVRYMVAFALLDFKVQGRTLPKLVVNIGSRPVRSPCMALDALYVMLSRTREVAGLRTLYPLTQQDKERLLKLKCNKHLAAWDAGYDRHGLWNKEACAKGFSQDGARPRPSAPASAACPTTTVRPPAQASTMDRDSNPFPMSTQLSADLNIH